MMKRYTYMIIGLVCSLMLCGLTSCDNDVYGDDSNIVLPPKPEITVTPVMGSWNLAGMQADVETGNAQLNEMIKQAIMGNALLQTIMAFQPVFTFDVTGGGVSVTAQGATFPGGNYTYEEEGQLLNYTLMLAGLSAFGIPDIGPVLLPIAIEASADGNTLTGRLDARFLVKEQLEAMGIPVDMIKVDLVITLVRAAG